MTSEPVRRLDSRNPATPRLVTAAAPTPPKRARKRDLSAEVLKQLQLLTDRPRLAPVVAKEEIRRALGGGANLGLSHERFNRILLFHGVEPITQAFFQHYFGGMVASPNALTDGVTRVRKDAMQYFGSFRRGFEVLGRGDPGENLSNPLANRERPHEPFSDLEGIPPEHLHLLGYTITPSELFPPNLIADVRRRARANTERYLSRSAIDMYIAASMRTPEQFVAGQDFIERVFHHPDVSGINLSYFNPLITWVDDRVQKGIVECLMLQMASAMIYIADLEDTFGKASELATMLRQGKPVLVYVPTDEREPKYEQRARLFKELHPLGFQIDQETGVANGVIVVRSAGECAEVLSHLFSREGLRTDITEDAHNYYLVERITQSPIRVVIKDKFITTAFWSHYPRLGDS